MIFDDVEIQKGLLKGEPIEDCISLLNGSIKIYLCTPSIRSVDDALHQLRNYTSVSDSERLRYANKLNILLYVRRIEGPEWKISFSGRVKGEEYSDDKYRLESMPEYVYNIVSKVVRAYKDRIDEYADGLITTEKEDSVVKKGLKLLEEWNEQEEAKKDGQDA